jgi:hypothetical protein
MFTLKQLLQNPRIAHKASKAEVRLREQLQRKQAKRQTIQREELAAVLLGGESGEDRRGFSELVRGISARGDKPR